MHVIAPARYQPKPLHKRKRSPLLLLLLVLLTAGTVNYLRPLPQPVASLTLQMPATSANVAIQWPSAAQATVAASGYGILGTSGTQTPLATASIAKVIVALSVLQKLPIAPGQSGPTYTVSAEDVAIYDNYVAQDGSVMRVVQGEKLTEYQALVALMLPSANNVSDSLVRWVFGSQQAYAAFATGFLQQNGLTNTHIGVDASGFDPSTTSTASDLTSLGLLALKNPVLMSIAAQKSANMPVVGTVYNYDTVLGANGITGLKTGNSEADPGAFLFTSKAHLGGKDLLLTGAIMGAADLNTALQGASQLSSTLPQNFEQVNIAASHQQIGNMKTAWKTSVPIVTSDALQLLRWKATPLTERHTFRTDIASGIVGSLKISAGQAHAQTNLELPHKITGPSFWWRLTRH